MKLLSLTILIDILYTYFNFIGLFKFNLFLLLILTVVIVFLLFKYRQLNIERNKLMELMNKFSEERLTLLQERLEISNEGKSG